MSLGWPRCAVRWSSNIRVYLFDLVSSRRLWIKSWPPNERTILATLNCFPRHQRGGTIRSAKSQYYPPGRRELMEIYRPRGVLFRQGRLFLRPKPVRHRLGSGATFVHPGLQLPVYLARSGAADWVFGEERS